MARDPSLSHVHGRWLDCQSLTQRINEEKPVRAKPLLAIAGIASVAALGTVVLLTQPQEETLQVSEAVEAENIFWHQLIGETSQEVMDEYEYISRPEVVDWDNPDWIARWEDLQTVLYPVKEDLAGEKVRLSGYIMPMEWESRAITKFLLVPYHGACIHVPAPPPNQVIWVEMPESSYEVQGYFDAVWVTGEIKIETTSLALAEAGYTITASDVEIYEIQ